MNTTEYTSVEQAREDMQAVPSYVEREMSQEEEEDLCYHLRQLELSDVVGVIDLAER
jgi:hypothetical protein